VESVSDVVAGFGALLKRRDLLLVDFRGTGGSAGLFCPEMKGSARLQAAMDYYLPPAGAKACAERLARTSDLSQYNNDSSVDDVDEVRAALGYEKINLYGGRLARLAGTYKDRESGMEIRVEPVGRHLRATIEGAGGPKLLVASSPTRFHMEGMVPGYTLVFPLSGGRAASLALEVLGSPSVKLAREGS
jgi:hypothetical protein